jgi:hypothetical protein
MSLSEKDKQLFTPWLYCPGCGYNWSYGWDSPFVLEEFLKSLKAFFCGNCKKVFNL